MDCTDITNVLDHSANKNLDHKLISKILAISQSDRDYLGTDCLTNFEYIFPNIHITDLTYLKTYTIDDKDTIEVDDAISLEKVDDKYKIWIHIASPALHVRLNDTLDIYARNKGSSSYLVDSIDTMFPREIVQSILTIKPKKKSLCLSTCIELRLDGSISNASICPSLIQNNYQLTYEDADELIELAPKEEPDLSILHKILERRRKFRQVNGAITIEGTEGRLKIVDKQLTLNYFEKTPSRVAIEEAMLLMGYVISSYAIKNKINIPFRCQEGVNIDLPNNDLHYSLNNSILRRSLRKSYISQKPSNHYSLGLSSYVQCTSPIRRYCDLLTHYQIINYLSNKPIITSIEMESLISLYQSKQKQVFENMRESKLFWTSKFIHKDDKNLLDCYFLRWINNKRSICTVFLLDYCFEITLQLKSKVKVSFADQIKLKITSTAKESSGDPLAIIAEIADN